MAGFKQTVLSHQPKLFLTFDGDPFDESTRKLSSVPQEFIDESGWGSSIILHNEDEAYPAYRMGIPSLIDLEQTDQHSCSFGWYGYQPTAMTRWPKAFIEVQHQSHLAFEDEGQLGSYTVGFFVQKAAGDDAWRDVEQDLGQGHWTNTLNKRWARKTGAFDIYYRDYWTQTDELRFAHPAGELVLALPSWFYGKKNFVVCTWSVTETDPDVYLTEARMYINGRLYRAYSNTTVATYPTSTSSSPIEIAGVINAASNFEDRQTNDLQLDQMFILNKALSADEICRLYRKSKTYDSIEVLSQPSAYWPMTDVEDPASTVMDDMMNFNNGTYQGGLTKFARQQPAPSQILGGSSVYFHDGGMATAHRFVSGRYEPLFTFTGDYTVHMWILFENSERSVIWSAQSDDLPHSGIVLEANRRNNINQPGHLQFSASQDYQVSSMAFQDNGEPYNFNDGRFHHVAMVRKSGAIHLWIDGILHGSVVCPVQSVSDPGQVYFMGMMPGHLNTQGYLSAVGVYGYALDDAEIRMRNAYSLIYRIQGTVTLEGNPHEATVRAYKHRTGALAREILSDSNSGDYQITLYDNSLIDLMVLNKQDHNIRYRVYGPITPAEYEDLP